MNKRDWQAFGRKHNMDVVQSWLWADSRPNSRRAVLAGVPCVVQIKQLKTTKHPYATLQRCGYQKLDFEKWTKKAAQELFKSQPDLAWVTFEPNKHIKISQRNNHTSSIAQETVNLDISKSEAELLANMSKSTRQNIKKAFKNGLNAHVYTEGDEALERFIEVIGQIHTSRDFIQVPIANYKNTWQTFSEAKKAYIVIGTYNNKDVGAFMRVLENKKAYQLYGGVTELGKQARLSQALVFSSILHAKKMKCINYDMWGASPFYAAGINKSHPLAGITEFKLSFGGELTAYAPPIVQINKKFAYYLIRPIEKRLTKIKHYLQKAIT